MTTPSLRELALEVLRKSVPERGTVAGQAVPAEKTAGTVKSEAAQEFNPTVPLSQPLRGKNLGQLETSVPNGGTVLGQSPYAEPFDAFAHACPPYVEMYRWRQCVSDGRQFLDQWGPQAEALGWTARDLFGLHTPPSEPAPRYRRLSRYDEIGLVWLLEGREVVALTEETAAIRWPGGSVTIYRRNNKPALGPMGDSLDDFA